MVQFWDDLWGKNLWWPAFANSFADLTAEQAAWRPEPGRNSIWQNLNHISFWREVVLRRLDGDKPSDEELEQRKFEQPQDPTDHAWTDALARFERSQKLVRDALQSGKLPEEKFKFMVPHDAYHVGQVMYIRALQGLPAVTYG
jgi:hypothetical protein